MKLTKNTKPKRLTLGQVWSLYLMDTGTETAEFVVASLDAFYPKLDREDVDIFVRFDKYKEARIDCDAFCVIAKGLVGNG